MATRKCKICGEEKELSYFYACGMQKDGSTCYRWKCKDCYGIKNQKYREEHKKEIVKQQKIYYEENKEKIIKQKKVYQEENKEKIAKYQKSYREENKEEVKLYREENKEIIAKQNKLYREEHKEEITKQRNKRTKERRKIDPSFRLRHNVGSSIHKAIKNNGGSKNGNSITKYLGKSFIEDLKDHLENQFEPWMTWENWGVYDKKTWKDEDPTTWKWQIDHIIPHSDFDYTSMEDEKFKKCWDLSNLRPLKATENHEDGVKRTRHKKK